MIVAFHGQTVTFGASGTWVEDASRLENHVPFFKACSSGGYGKNLFIAVFVANIDYCALGCSNCPDPLCLAMLRLHDLSVLSTKLSICRTDIRRVVICTRLNLLAVYLDRRFNQVLLGCSEHFVTPRTFVCLRGDAANFPTEPSALNAPHLSSSKCSSGSHV